MLKLQTKERILLHLADYDGSQFNDVKNEFPFILTQQGIADALESSLERVSTNLKLLEKEGLVKKKKEYSRKTGRFRNFYFLTSQGNISSDEIKKRLNEEWIHVRDLNDELKEMQIDEVIHYLKKMPKSETTGATYELKEATLPEINYTNIVKHMSNGVLDLRIFVEPKFLNLDKHAWSLIRDAYYDPKHRYVVLTKNRNWQAGALWLKKGIRSTFVAEFRYKAGGGTGGDGFVFMFYKKKNYWPCDGGNLGFVPGITPVPGYGIEFDGLPNPDYNDPPYPHVALIQGHVNNHLKHVREPKVNDFKWHEVKVAVEKSKIAVYLDRKKILKWNGPIDRSYDGLGFAGSTGGLDNWHIIDDVKVTKLTRTKSTKHQKHPKN